MPILYSFRRCPYAMRARLAIAVSGQTCELREIILRDKPADMLRASPKGTVPVLIDDDGRVIEQSLDIMLWALRGNDPQSWLAPQRGSPADMQALIELCDGEFKQHLDRYKYPDRYEGVDGIEHRTAGAVFLHSLEARLQGAPYLFGDRICMADMAIAPFVRQFANTGKDWFDQQHWPALRTWLADIVDSALFEHILLKFPRWEAGTQGVSFP
jgi:glutathione S-transferase